jgi:hypothetical protein
MSPDPYTPPVTLEVVDLPTPEVPPKILKKIEKAWGIGVIAGFLLGVSTLAASSNRQWSYAMWNWGTVLFVLSLTFGIYRKSRTCAVLLLIVSVSWIGLMILAGKTTGMVLLVIFTYYQLQGVIGIFAYHRFVSAQLLQGETRKLDAQTIDGN